MRQQRRRKNPGMSTYLLVYRNLSQFAAEANPDWSPASGNVESRQAGTDAGAWVSPAAIHQQHHMHASERDPVIVAGDTP